MVLTEERTKEVSRLVILIPSLISPRSPMINPLSFVATISLHAEYGSLMFSTHLEIFSVQRDSGYKGEEHRPPLSSDPLLQMLLLQFAVWCHYERGIELIEYECFWRWF
jgi:hypothetical protein